MTVAERKRMRVRAIFVGENGSMGYRNGDVYELLIAGNDVIEPHPCPYTVAGFLANWRQIEVWSPDA